MPMNIPNRANEESKMQNVRVINIGQSQTPINFMDGLALLFIGLRLTGHLETWTWVEILAPLWVPFMVHWFIRLVVHTFFSEDEGDE
jgi:hypothetical protein